MSTAKFRTAVVAGASRGIGRAIAAMLLSDGWQIFNLDHEAPSEHTERGDSGFVTGHALYVCVGITLSSGGS